MNKKNNGTDWQSIISESPLTVRNFAEGYLTLRELAYSLSPENRRYIYRFEQPGAGGTQRARVLARKACRRHGIA